MQLSRGPFEVRLRSDSASEPVLRREGTADSNSSQPCVVHGSNAVETEPLETEVDPILDHMLQENAVQRNFDCNHYETCLGLAAALNWDSFTCTACSRKINPQLVWRAHQNVRQEKSKNEICGRPEIKKHVPQ
mgnify:FL=1